MNYSLGNTLSRGGALNPDGLSLDLQFATDKTLTARKGPTPTFTRASTATFVGSDGLIQSAAINDARFDHDPVTLASKGLLIEESRTNVGLQSEAFDTSTWDLGTQRNLTVAANNIASPSGATTADRLTVGATTTVYQVVQSTPTLTSGTVYTVSCFFKANQVTRVALYATTTATLPVSAIFELSGSGTVVQTSFGTASIQRFPDGWYRCVITGTAGVSVPTSVRISPVTGTSTIYTGNSVDSFYAWGYQLEAGAFPTSYIPTVAASGVRSVDLCSITGSAFTGMYNASEGTLFAQHFYSLNNLGRPIHISDGSSATNAIEIFNGTGPSCNVFSAGSQQYTRNVTATTNTVAKSSLAIATSNAMLCVNGTLATSGGGLMPIGVNQLNIGNRPDGARPLNGHIASIRYYKKRLANAKLQTLTT